MGTILREGGYSVRLYTKDHEPPHVHVVRGRGEAKIRLGLDGAKPALLGAWDMSDRDLARALILVDKHHARLQDAWEALYGR